MKISFIYRETEVYKCEKGVILELLSNIKYAYKQQARYLSKQR